MDWAWRSFCPPGVGERVGVVGRWCVGGGVEDGPIASSWGVRVRRKIGTGFEGSLSPWRILRMANEACGSGTNCKCRIRKPELRLVFVGF